MRKIKKNNKMKTINLFFIFFISVVMISVMGCNVNSSNDIQTVSKANDELFEPGANLSIMTMSTRARKVTISLKGTGTATVDWGDGSKIVTTKPTEGAGKDVQRRYSNTNPRTITITGDNITGLIYCDNQITALDVNHNKVLTLLWCFDNQLSSLDISRNVSLTELRFDNNQLTKLDASKNIALANLYCTENQFSDEALNNLFDTLHDNDLIRKIVYINGNPGTANCNTNIAKAKGWVVNDLYSVEKLSKSKFFLIRLYLFLYLLFDKNE